MSATRKELADYARILRNAAPQEFSNFHTAFGKYTDFRLNNLVFATGDLPLAQGHAQQCVELLRILEGIKNG
jgi:hypothetical protein